MAEKITSPSVLISMLIQLRQENRKLSHDLAAARVKLRALGPDLIDETHTTPVTDASSAPGSADQDSDA